jgi:hypothetical protein
MAEPSDVVDSYLASRYRTGLEQVLLDATGGYVTPAVAAVVDVAAERFETRRHPDGGVSEGYEGTLTVQGVAYQYRCWVYLDFDGSRCLSDLSEFSPIGWQARIRLTDAGA